MLVSLAQRSSLRHRSLPAVFAAGLMLRWISQAYAYRPFDGTDAAVADPGEAEVELQPAGAQWSRGQNLLTAPQVVFNYGFLENWEAVLATANPIFSFRRNESLGLRSLPQAHNSAGRASGSARSQYRRRVRCSTAGQQWGQPVWRKHRCNHIAAVGLGNSSFEYDRRAYAQSASGCLS